MLLLQEIIAAIDNGIARLGLGAGIFIYFLEGPTEKPAAMLTRVRVPGAARDFSPRTNFQCRLLRCPNSSLVGLGSTVLAAFTQVKSPKFCYRGEMKHILFLF